MCRESVGAFSRVIGRALVISACLDGGVALAIEPAQCADRYEAAQKLRRAGKLLAAREALIACAQDECPVFAQRDCDRWLVEVDNSIPTIVVTAQDVRGNDVPAVRVLVDGATVAAALDGKAIAIDPGGPTVRYEASAGVASRGEHITALAGVKNPKVTVILPPSPEDQPLVEISAPTPGLRPPGIEVWILGGVGLVGLAGFGGFGIASLNEEARDRNGGCAPDCNAAQVASIRKKEHIAD